MPKSLHSAAHAKLLQVLIAKRHEQKLTQHAVAQRLQKPQSYIAKLEGGERRLDIVEFAALADALGIDASLLFADVMAAMREAGH
jgi:transcriptional regulator with XRE-family HTH domain